MSGAGARSYASASMLRRWGAPVAALLAEYVFVSLRVDAHSVVGWGGSWRFVGELGRIAPLGIVLVTTVIVLRPTLRSSEAEEQKAHDRPLRPWALFAHLAFLAALFTLTERIFTASAPPVPALLWIGAWVASVGFSTLSLFAFFGHSIAAPRGLLTASVGAAVAVAAAAWLAGMWSMELWEPLARITLDVVATMLGAFFTDGAVDPTNLYLQLGSFAVQVAPVCSGFEGIGLVGVLVSGYLFAFRDELRFPRALLLLPLGIVSVWFGNCLRIAVLMIIGAYVSEPLAYGAFHSKAGWIVFSAVVLALAALGHRTRFFSRRALDDVENPSAAFLLPFLVFASTALVSEALEVRAGTLYPLRVGTALLCMFALRNDYRALLVRPSVWSALAGALVGGAWMLVALHETGTADAPVAGFFWQLARIVGAVVVAPFVEELAFRGYLQRWLIARDFARVPLESWSPTSLVLTSLAFGMLHHHVIAGILAGIVFGLVQIRTGRLTDAIVSHATANAVLVVGVLATGNWRLLA